MKSEGNGANHLRQQPASQHLLSHSCMQLERNLSWNKVKAKERSGTGLITSDGAIANEALFQTWSAISQPKDEEAAAEPRGERQRNVLGRVSSLHAVMSRMKSCFRRGLQSCSRTIKKRLKIHYNST